MKKTEEFEKTIRESNPSVWSYFYWHLSSLILMMFLIRFEIMGIFAALIPTIIAELMRRATVYRITTKKIHRIYNFVSRDETYTTYSKIQNVTLKQTFLDKDLNIGTLEFDTAGTHSRMIIFKDVPNPLSFKHDVEKMLHKL